MAVKAGKYSNRDVAAVLIVVTFSALHGFDLTMVSLAVGVYATVKR
jgi:hypothetical protein